MPVERFQEQIVWSSGRFRVDDVGRVWRGAGRAEQRLPSGYLQVRAMIQGRRHHTCAHRLVWHAIKGPIPRGLVINHRNGRKDDNRPDNLELVTYSGNMKHAHRTGLKDQHGQRNPAAKLSDNQVAQIRNMYASGGYTMERLASIYGVAFQHVSRLVRGTRRRKQGGPISTNDLRHISTERDSKTGRFCVREFPEARP